jgi:hypothetical protein
MNIITEIKKALPTLGFNERQIVSNYGFADIQQHRFIHRVIPLSTFSTYPYSYRSACIGVVTTPPHTPTSQVIQDNQALGAPLLLEITPTHKIQAWSITTIPKPLGKPFEPAAINQTFEKERQIWGIENLGRIKRPNFGATKPPCQQELFDRNLLPTLSRRIREQLRLLLEETSKTTIKIYHEVHGSPPNLQHLFPFLFRFLTVKIFQDRHDAEGWENLGGAQEVFDKADAHYGTGKTPRIPQSYFHKEILERTWDNIAQNLNFANIAISDLAAVYETTFITPENRKVFGVHSTPEPLAEYIVQNLPWENLPLNQRRVFEPFSGHAILLASAMSRLGQDLPPNWSTDKRHNYFRKNLAGVEKDSFAVEVSRLLLTLSDYPNHNGWNLETADVFTWKGWNDTLTNNCDVLLANPPYENFSKEDRQALNPTKTAKPAEMLHRLMQTPPTMLGLVLPQSFLTSPIYKQASRKIAKVYKNIRIIELPEIFNYAKNETIALMASGKRENGRRTKVSYSEVAPNAITSFFYDYHVSNQREAEITITDNDKLTLHIPRQYSFIEKLTRNNLLGNIAEIHKGINWIPQKKKLPHSNERTDVASNTPKKGYQIGCEKMNGNLQQFQIKRFRYLSLLDEDQDAATKANKRNWSRPKVVFNAARFGKGSPWRLASFPDETGLVFTKQFFAIWPKEEISIPALAAIINSPVANIFSHQNDLERHNHIETLVKLPLPPLNHLKPNGLLDKLTREFQQELKNKNLPDTTLFSLETGAEDDKLREKLMRIDAAILDAYALPAAEQRKLLDQFTDFKRPINFEFGNYFPKWFHYQITLTDFIRIRYDWNTTNNRRCYLINKKIYSPNKTSPDELTELEQLQYLADLLPYVFEEDPHREKATNNLIEKLKAENKWEE